jgi:hypothetical protein
MVVVCCSLGTDRLAASAALKEKLQMKFISHFYAYILLYGHLNSKSFLSYMLNSPRRYKVYEEKYS